MGFHGFSAEQGKGNPFVLMVSVRSMQKRDTCDNVKQAVIERFGCGDECVKVAVVDSENNPSAARVICELEDSDEKFWKMHNGCSIMVEHKHQGMRFN
jgi:hypothetical protein